LSQLWSLASHVFDARQAKRLFGFLGAGALLGGIAGGMAARLTAQLSETRNALLVVAILLLGVVVSVRRLKPAQADPAGPPRPDPTPRVADSRDALATVLRSGQLRLIAALMLMVIVVSQIVDLQFSWAVEKATSGLDDRTAFFGNFFSIMGVAAFIFQLVLTTRIHRTLGVGFALRVLPTSLTAGTIALLIAGSMFPGALIVVAVGLKITENGIRYSLDDSTRELLFLPVPAADRAKSKTFLDLFVKRAGKGVAALLLFPVTLGWITPLQAGWLSLAIIGLWLAMTSRITREYVLSFRRGLKQKTVDTGTPINLSDVTTLEILVQSLGSPDPRQVLHSLDILSAHDRGHLVPPLLLYHDDAEVRRRTLQVLAAEGREDAAPLVERRLSDQSPAVRAEATRVLADLWHQDACDMMLPRLKSSDPGVRAAAIACLTNHGDAAMQEQASAALKDMTSDADPAIRIEGARAVGAISEPHFEGKLVQMLYDPDPNVVRAAVQGVKRRAARDGSNPLYLATLISLLANRRLKHDAREALAAFGESAIPALRLFMNDPEEPLWVRRAIPKTISLIDSPLATETLVDSLEDPTDTFLRRKLLEALDSLGVGHDEPARKQKIRREVHVEAKRYLIALADLHALNVDAAVVVDGFVSRPSPTRGMALLEQLLAERTIGPTSSDCSL
jgi:AAA family ATP:ADP antiporter